MSPARVSRSIHKRITLALQAVLLVGMVLSVLQGLWITAISVAGIMAVTVAPVMLGRRFRVFIPHPASCSASSASFSCMC